MMGGRGGGGGGGATGGAGQVAGGGDYVPMHTGGPVPQGSEAHISQFLEGLSHEQLWSMIANMKEQIEQTPEQARQILESNPQLAYALLQAQVLLGMVKTEQLVAALDHAQQHPVTSAHQSLPTPQPMHSGVPMPILPDQMMQQPMYGGFGAPMQPAYSGHSQGIAPEHSDLLRQVTALTPADIAMLPPDQREQVLAIRRQIGL
jgi:cleavage stimulation factor subunit 2